ncbi:MAG: preprotein translocase subunit YajC [Bacteroidales bacterium]|nr:preprotein translocase subunit YajC [Bacteroidales bacterium]
MLNTILTQAQAQGSGMSGLLMIVAMIAIFYFVMIRPQNKKQKEIKRQREAMKNGDRVVTAGGIHGKIRDIKDATVLIEVAPGVSLKIDKASVYPAVEEKAAPKAEKSSKKEKAEVVAESEDKK